MLQRSAVGARRFPVSLTSARWLPATFLPPVLLFYDALLGRRILAPADGFVSYVPWYTQVADQWQHGHLPALNPFSYAGYPLLAIHQSAVFYPGVWLFMVLPTVQANNVFIVLSFVLAGIGAGLFTRTLCDGDPIAASVAGATYGLCGFLVGHIGHHSIIATAVWLPWALYGFEILRVRVTFGRLLLASLPVLLAALAGHSQTFATVLMVLSLYALFVTLGDLRVSKGRPLLILVAMVSVGVALAAVQLIPTLAYIGFSARDHLTYADAVTYSFPKSHGALLLFPYLFGVDNPSGPFTELYAGAWNITEMAGYPGAGALALAGAGLSFARRDRRVLAVAGVGAVALLVSFGPATPVSRLVYALPLYGQFRAWARYVVAFDLAVAVLAGYGVMLLRSGQPEERRAALIRTVLVAVTVVVAGAVLPRLTVVRQFLPEGRLNVAAILGPALAAASVAVLAFLTVKRERLASALVVVVALDVILSYGAFAAWRNGSPKAALVADARDSKQASWGSVTDQGGGIDRYLIIGSPLATANDYGGFTDFRGLSSANGYDPLAPKEYVDALGMVWTGSVTEPAWHWAPGSDLLDLLRVTTVLVDRSVGSPPSDSGLTGGSQLPGVALDRYEHVPRLPEGFLVGSSLTMPRRDIVEAVRGQRAFDPATQALLERECAGCPTGEPGPAGVVLRSDRGSASMTLDVTASRPALLVLSQAWLPGWSASVSGRPAPVLRADGVLQGVPVPAGNHRVVLRYVPPGFRLGATISLVTLLLALGGIFVERRRARRSRSDDSHSDEESGRRSPRSPALAGRSRPLEQ